MDIKGSKFWMQKCINSRDMKHKINKELKSELTWVCPSMCGFKEYELRTQGELFGKNSEEMEKVFSFWPKGQPRWDGIAIAPNTLYLFEAKAHINELNSSCRASDKSIVLIERSMREIQTKYYPQGNFNVWMKGYYQLANRLTFLHKLNEKSSYFPNIDGVKLVLMGFSNDETYKPTTQSDLEKAFKNAWSSLTGLDDYDADVQHIVIDVKNMI